MTYGFRTKDQEAEVRTEVVTRLAPPCLCRRRRPLWPFFHVSDEFNVTAGIFGSEVSRQVCILDKKIIAELQLTVKTVLSEHFECRVRVFEVTTWAYDLEDQKSCFDSRHKEDICLFSKEAGQLLMSTQRPIKWVPAADMWNWRLLSSVKNKNGWNRTYTLPYALMACIRKSLIFHFQV